ncbi:MAG TPA: fibrobacter succinogenes major paralogous domain-containing protein [Parafilimonas sp.]|nr:fibrobacter succinogenes major paralogous domain-containing protein [Parafilimonas sp.]
MNTSIKTALAAIGLLVAFSCKKESTNRQLPIHGYHATDVVAGKYAHVNIGSQVWMTNNLDVTHYRNGDKIPQVKDATKWAALTTGAWCWFNNDSAIGAVYGRLYNWYAVHDPRGLAPLGWHVPSDLEWNTLSTYLGGDSVAGGKMKTTGIYEEGSGRWHKPNLGATNSSGFSALPGSLRYNDGSFSIIGYYGRWWSSTKSSATNSWDRSLNTWVEDLGRSSDNKQFGFSVRCIKD